ncbi:cytochrome P450 [Goodfellowiella coeruleoviolacea]|uniref:Cytochrome P450 n=1 Tax=Goodfellowiella coeruleoviolacea TaxID=334858 RepID=A0AAE3GL38_9PSEU|nr:cytochrome P450 [Goodfellowiella coeruleoviolacea]MCP2170191.1 Cytochrome P450 [Goodfellowiella coeruleoviolacea]
MSEQVLPQVDPSLLPPSTRTGLTDMVAWLGRMRREHPVHRDMFGIHHVFSHSAAQQVLADPTTFSSDPSHVMPAAAAELTSGMLAVMDPPGHTKVRKIASQAFTPKRVKNLSDRIEAIAEELLDQITESEFDFVARFSQQLPLIVVSELLGIPRADLPLFLGWTEKLLAVTVPNPNDEAELDASIASAQMGPLIEMQGYMHQFCAGVRAQPNDGFLSDLLQAEVDGQRLGDHEVVNLAIQLVQAGHITSASLLANSVLTLSESPELAARLRADSSLVAGFVDEVLRTKPPVPRLQRFTTTDTELDGVAIPAKSMVFVWLLSANHDESVFADAVRFDPERAASKALTFGHGIHYCFGAALAKTEARVGLAALFRRFAEFEVAPDAQIEFYEGEMFTPKSVPLRARTA